MADLASLLKQALQNDRATFKIGQEEAILAALQPPHRALVVQATGWGKSMVYFIATRVLRDSGRGPTIVISPLLSLMRDQRRAAESLGLTAREITSENTDDFAEVDRLLRADKLDLLLVSPMRLGNEDFRSLVASSGLSRAGLIVIDEAHCVSDWGHDFMPDYQRIGEFIRKLPATMAVLATTATANDRVVLDIENQLGRGIRILRGPLARASLKLQVIRGFNAAQRLAWLADHIQELPGSGIIYTLTTHDADRVARWLQENKINVLPYHAALSANRDEQKALRIEREAMLLNNEVKALAATVALGMGFDKPDLGFVVHFQSPGNLVAYYQQIGRAGRAIPEALAVLFLGHEDSRIHEWFITNARPDEQIIAAVLAELDEEPLTVNELTERLNHPKVIIEKVLKTLGVTSPAPIVKIGSEYQRTPVDYLYDREKEHALADRRRTELRRFEGFANTEDCLMKVVQQELDDSMAAPCGRCANCLGHEIVPSNINSETVARAMAFLRRGEFPIRPRLRWQKNAFPVYGFTGNIDANERCEEGICLAHYGEPVYGEWAQHDKVEGRFRDELVKAVATAVNRAQLSRQPEWVCAIPSTRSANLVPDFAQRLARELSIDYIDAIEKVNATEPQKSQKNSYHQARNLDDAFTVRAFRNGLVLLVDDMVDSRWTFTVVGALLRRSGVEAVVPVAICSTGHVNPDE